MDLLERFSTEVESLRNKWENQKASKKQKPYWSKNPNIDYWGWVRRKASNTKGAIGEGLFDIIADTSPRTSTKHDRVVKDIRHEIKLSCVGNSGKLKWIHMKLHDDWEMLTLIGLYPQSGKFPNYMRLWCATKDEVQKLFESGFIYKHVEKELRIEVNAFQIPKWMEPLQYNAEREFGIAQINPEEYNNERKGLDVMRTIGRDSYRVSFAK